jgi:hypothetical protein
VAVWAVDFSGRNIQAGSGALFPFLLICNDRFDGFQADKKKHGRGEIGVKKQWSMGYNFMEKFLELTKCS